MPNDAGIQPRAAQVRPKGSMYLMDPVDAAEKESTGLSSVALHGQVIVSWNQFGLPAILLATF